MIEKVNIANGNDDTFVEVGINGDTASIWIDRLGNDGDGDGEDDCEDGGDVFGFDTDDCCSCCCGRSYVIVAIGYFASICKLGISGGRGRCC